MFQAVRMFLAYLFFMESFLDISLCINFFLQIVSSGFFHTVRIIEQVYKLNTHTQSRARTHTHVCVCVCVYVCVYAYIYAFKKVLL